MSMPLGSFTLLFSELIIETLCDICCCWQFCAIFELSLSLARLQYGIHPI